MDFTRTEKLDIGRRIYDGEISKNTAVEEYGISISSARTYMRLYRDTNQLPPKKPGQEGKNVTGLIKKKAARQDLEDYKAMSKEELIQELVMSKIVEARLKKGYEVKGVGAEKEFILLGSKNTK